jgi:hypothetical protein
MKERTINFKFLPHAEMYQYTVDWLGIGTRIGLANLKIEEQVNTLVLPALKSFDEAYKKERKSDFTDGIGALDKLRDNKTSAIHGIVNTAAFDSDPKKVEASKKIKKWFGEFKGINKKPFKAQSADTTNFIQGFRGKYAPEVEILGLGKWIDELEEVNNQVIAMFGERIDEKKEKGKLDTEEARKKLISAYRTVGKYVEVLIAMEAGDPQRLAIYNDYIASVNILISEYLGGSGKTTVSDKPAVEGSKETYPDAIEWVENFGVQNAENGMIFYIIVDGEKVFYKLLDRAAVGFVPGGTKYQEYWEKLS